MTVAEAIIKYLDESSKDPDFDINGRMDWLESKVADICQDWADENGYDYNDNTCLWEKKP